ANVRLRAQSLDVQPERVGAVRVGRADGPDLARGVLVPSRDREGPAGAALRRGAPPAGKRAPGRGREFALGREGGKGEGLRVERPVLVEGRPLLSGGGAGRPARSALRRLGGGGVRARD